MKFGSVGTGGRDVDGLGSNGQVVQGTTVDKHTDIWAFGCVLYEVLSGKTGVSWRDDLGLRGGGAVAGSQLGSPARDNARLEMEEVPHGWSAF